MIRFKLTVFCLALAALSANVQAANIFWTATTDGSDFSLAANWTPATFPTSADVNRMENNISGSILTAPFTCNELWLGSTTAANAALGIYGSGILNQSDFTLTVPNYVEIGEGFTDTTRDNVPGGTGILNLSGNAIFNHTTVGWMNIGEAASGAATTGTVNMSGNAVLNNDFGRFILGNGASGIGNLNISDTATLNLGNDFHNIGFLGGNGYVHMTGGTVNNTSGGYLLAGGFQGTGTWIHDGGTINSTSNPLTLGDGAGSTGNFYLNGGIIYTSGVVAGIGWDTGNATGNFYFNGGELRASSSSTNFMGAAQGTASNPGTLNVYVQAGGAKINTNGFNVTVPMNTTFWEDTGSPGGGLTKLGAGTLTLNNATFFTGNIAVNAGTLLVNVPGSLVFSPTTTVASGATLGGSSGFQNVVVQAPDPVTGARGTLIPGDGATNNNVPMFNLDINSAELKFYIHKSTDSALIDLSGSGTGILNVSTSSVSGNTLKNIITLYQNQALASDTLEGDYILMKYKTVNYLTGGDFAANFDLPNKYLGDFDVTPGTKPDVVPGITDIYIHLAPSSNQWQAPQTPSSNFLYSNTANWVTGAAVGVPNAQGAKALFSTGGTPPTVTLDMNVTLGKLVFKNATSYTISAISRNHFILDAGPGVPAEVDDLLGNHTIAAPITLNKQTNFVVSGDLDTLTVSGIISGSSIPPLSVTKDGPGTLVFSANNTYDGSTAIIGGTLQLDGANNYTGATTVTNGMLLAKVIANAGLASSIGKPATTSASNLVLNASTLKYTGTTPASTDRGITLANAVTIDSSQNLAINGPAVMGTDAGPNVTLNTPGAGTITLGGQITSAGVVNKAGAGTLTYAAGAGVVSSLANAGGPAFYIQNGNVIIAGADNSTQYNTPGGEISVGTTAANAGNFPVSLTINSGTVNVGTWQSIGRGNTTTSTLTMNGGVLNAVSTSMGYDAGQTGYTGTQILNMNNNSVYNNTGTPFYVGESGGSNATVNMANTSLLTCTTGPMWVGNAVGSTGTLNINNSAQISVATFLSVGLNGTGHAKIEGATSRLFAGNDLNVGDSAGAVGTIDVLGGTVQTVNLWVARNGNTTSLSTGTITQSAGAVIATNLTTGGGTAIYNLDGGSLTANIIRKDPASTTGTGTLNFNGGVLKAGASDDPANPTTPTWFLTGLTAANVKAGGAVIDTNGFNVTVNQILAADSGSLGGGLTKQGIGKLTVTQVATYSGNTAVSNGTLDMLNINTPTATVSVAGGADLTATSIAANTLTIASGGTVVIKAIPGGPQASLSITPVPEPGTLALLAMAALVTLVAARRKKQ
jgi:autotransporter-associated beta strand protein